MAEKIINTRIQLKYDTYENWTTNNPVLKAGELAIATIAVKPTQTANSVEAPQVLIKVGDGEKKYNDLKFVSGMAADVYSWAKAENKPSYQASEITGLSDYIAGEIEDTDTQYTVVKVNDYQYKLQSKAKGDGEYTDTGVVIDIPKYDDTALANRVSILEGEDSGKSARAIAAEETAKIVAGADTAYDTLKEVADWISSHTTDAASMNSAILKLQAIVDGIGDEGEDATVVEYVTKAIAALENSLAAIAKTGNVNDLVQTDGDVLILNCGSSAI